ncbi:bacillithiol biosynthesis cysteine-adding enzyme BshC [Pustulibacterium marinum]|uniref:Putative cysteine ligase BshC n=1 Tax=Pustulibacterium marinum TaxID=1224947 RepID=A0A1I7FA75_9FLAO|nr:bacillithiol biosynthesis cysteine-adding enzyme BshC [Pustulibacterium marinum]SFU33087.1 bacillithiol biosynthesis cysteine-adding enzyme BshC [Pustulibacterium marinum]
MAECISYRKTNYFSSLIADYLDQKETLKDLYNHFPNVESFQKQINEKSSFQQSHRTVLKNALLKQYESFKITEISESNIVALEDQNTFTITTGHQLNLFTGPLYFLYKIVSTINLTKELKESYPTYNFVPVYWMATEDHDFEEISYFNFKGKKIHWNRESAGAVGHFSTDGLAEVFELFSQDLGIGKNAETLRELFTNAYLRHDNLTDATRYLVNELFGTYGLVIVDGDDKALKELFVPYVKEDIFQNTAFQQVSKSAEKLADLGYNVQVNPREINMFYLTENGRERIVEVEGNYEVLDTDVSFSKEELLRELENYPEKFSPNVIMRPLYQEVILPNLCYIGGGGELAYWLELKSNFDVVNIPFPMLLLRNSALLVTAKQAQKLKKLNISYPDLFLKRDSFINKKVREISNIDIDFSHQKKHLESQFKELYNLAEQTDPSFIGAVKAQEIKQLKGLENLEKRLLKAQKRKLSDHVLRITDLQNELFPNQSLQERNLNFSEMFLMYGDELIPMLLENLKPLKGEFLVLEK